MDAVICTGRISGCLKGECFGETERGNTRIRISRGISGNHQERVWRRRRRVGESSKVEEVGARRKDNGRVCSRV